MERPIVSLCSASSSLLLPRLQLSPRLCAPIYRNRCDDEARAGPAPGPHRLCCGVAGVPLRMRLRSPVAGGQTSGKRCVSVLACLSGLSACLCPSLSSAPLCLSPWVCSASLPLLFTLPPLSAGDEVAIARGVYEDFFTVEPTRRDGSVTQDLYIHGEPGTVLQAPVRKPPSVRLTPPESG